MTLPLPPVRLFPRRIWVVRFVFNLCNHARCTDMNFLRSSVIGQKNCVQRPRDQADVLSPSILFNLGPLIGG